MNKFKKFLYGTLGIVGYILYFIISCFIFFFPLFYLNTGVIWKILSGALMLFFPPASLVFWIWGLVETINGFTTGIWAICYYVFFAIGWIPYFIFNVIIPCVQSIITLSTPIPNYRRDPRWTISEPLSSDIHPLVYIEKYDADTMEQSVKNELGAAFSLSLDIMGIEWTMKNFNEELDDNEISAIRDNTLYAETLPDGSNEKAQAMAYICQIAQKKLPKITHPEWRKFIKTSLFLDPILKKPTYRM